MNIGISNWNYWSYDPTKMKFSVLYQSFTQLLTFKHLKLNSTKLVEQNREMWKTCISAHNAKKEN